MTLSGKSTLLSVMILAVAASALARMPGKGRILIRADRVSHTISRLTTGACLEDVNHEVYGGIYSQMIFGESFEEPAPAVPIAGFWYEGSGLETPSAAVRWEIRDGLLVGPAAEGPKLVSKDSTLSVGSVEVEMRFDDRAAGVAGLIVKVSDAGPGADNFNGYEISLDPEKNQIIFGKHQHNWQPLRRVDCPIAINTWMVLRVDMDRDRLTVFVNDQQYIDYTDDDSPLEEGLVGLRTWQRPALFRNFRIQTASGIRQLPFRYAKDPSQVDQVSSMWGGFREGQATGTFAVEQGDMFNGHQSQRLTFVSGNGRVGIANWGLNRRGMYFEENKPYEGLLWARADKPVTLTVALEDRHGHTQYDQQTVEVTDGRWQRIEFALSSSGLDDDGRFSVALSAPGSVVIGYVFLQPGPWGRFKDLPVRRDVAEALIQQQLTVLRYGGCMVNAPEYRWKKMIGPRDQRPPYRGWWYPYSSNGWGIIDFVNFCEAAGFVPVPAFNIYETPEDMADFVEYVNGGPDTRWGRRRAEDGHPAPYHLKYIQIGNEESVDQAYLERFSLLAEAIWSKDPSIIPVVGDFAYNAHIDDPYSFEGAPRIRSLAVHRQILQFAKKHGKPAWFDVHIWNHDPRDPDRLDKGMGMYSFIEALKTLDDGADFKVCVFEENATNHCLRRGLAHAHAINEIQRSPYEIPILCAANCLQPDGQNDNGWDQGLLFLNQSKVWPQPSYYVTQMLSQSYQPLCVESYTDSYQDALDVTACKSADGKTLSVHVVNLDRWSVTTEMTLINFTPHQASAQVLQIKGDLNDRNTADKPDNIVPTESRLPVSSDSSRLIYTFPAYSLTIINFE